MPTIRMVRHGEAGAGYSEHPDPGLSEQGRLQAEAVAATLEPLGPLAIVSSPMARAKETAAPLARLWEATVAIEPGVSEIPSPGLTPAQRGPWLQNLMSGTWGETPDAVRAWRDGIAAALLTLETDAVVFSHFVAINAALSVALGTDGPRVAHLDHCSVTTFSTDDGQLALVETGGEGDTVVL